MAVVHIEATRGAAALADPALPSSLADIAAVTQASRNAAAVQIDFDARASQREFYRRMLAELRRKLPPEVPISITALASWCAFDHWISSLPVDEAVPMFFRMGDEPRSSSYDQHGYPLREPLCEGRQGISTDEPGWLTRDAVRIYVFHPHRWNKAAIEEAEVLLARE